MKKESREKPRTTGKSPGPPGKVLIAPGTPPRDGQGRGGGRSSPSLSTCDEVRNRKRSERVLSHADGSAVFFTNFFSFGELGSSRWHLADPKQTYPFNLFPRSLIPKQDFDRNLACPRFSEAPSILESFGRSISTWGLSKRSIQSAADLICL